MRWVAIPQHSELPVCYHLGGSRGGDWQRPSGFRTIQVSPKDLPVIPRQAQPCGEPMAGGGAMKINRRGIRIGVTVLALSLLAIPTSQAQKAAGISRVGWLEVCGPGPRRPHFDIFRGRLAELRYVEGKNLISSSDLQIAATTGCRG